MSINQPFIFALVLGLMLSGCGGKSNSSSNRKCVASTGSAVFAPTSDASQVTMTGEIDCSIIEKVNTLTQDKKIKTIIMKSVLGSSDDVSNLKAAKIIHDANIDIQLADDGVIASGGVDFFLAGIKRTVGKDARVAVHSWADGDGTQGIELYSRNPDAAAHLEYINYYKSIGFTADNAKEFYVFTLKAAPAASVHCMSADELKRYKVVTDGQLAGTTPLLPKTEDGKDVCRQ